MQTTTHRVNEQQGPTQSTGNSIQCPGLNHSDRNIQKDIYMRITESLCLTTEINAKLSINSTSIKNKF